MRAPAPALLLALGLAGCAAIQGVALPAPAPPPVRPTEVAAAPPPRVTSPQPELPPAPAAPPPAPVPAPPAPPAPARPVAPPAETPPPPPPPAAPPPLVLAPQVSSEDERRIHGEAQRRIDGTERLVRQIDQRRLVEEQHQNLLTIQSFLVKAKEALSERDMQRAMTLADKAYLLADELFRRLR